MKPPPPTRTDRAFLDLYEKHKDLVEELEANFTPEEILKLALELPEDYNTYFILAPGMIPRGCATTWLTRGKPLPRTVSVYVACAVQHHASKVLGEILKQQEAVKAQLAQLKGFVSSIDTNKTPLLRAAVCGKFPTVKEPTDGED